MAPSSPHETYSQRRAAWLRSASLFAGRSRRLSYARLAVALAGVVMAGFAFGPGTVALGWLLLPIVLFTGLMGWHARVEREWRRARLAVAFYERGLARLEDRWPGTGTAGDRFRDPHHPYAEDLDLFGRGSLFELLCTARTGGGEERLADWLREPAEPDQVHQRQEAVRDLQPRLELREQLAVVGDDVRRDLHPRMLTSWARAEAVPFPAWARVVAPLLVTATLAAAAGVALDAWNGWVPLLAILAQMAFAQWLQPRVREVARAADAPGRDLALLAQVLACFEAERFTAPRLKALHEALQSASLPPSRQIARLDQLLTLLDARLNQFFMLLGWTLLWTTQLAMAVEAWRRLHGTAIVRWLDAVSEMEALGSLASHAYEHPDDAWPTFRPEAGLAAEALAHVLLPETRAVRNDLALGDAPRLLVVSGSNMSGKSTLLRAAGLAVVMAQAGAPVRARRLCLSALQVGSSIRVNDSLQEGASRFYAEITRLRQVVELTRGGRPVLFLLDEVLSGTNSHDRRIGAEAVVRSLVERGAVGLVTTHDLALAQIADSLGPRGANVHFEDRMEAGTMHFDYTMRPGVVSRSNALELMRSVGLDV